MAKPSGPRRSAPEVELCIPVIDEDSTKGRRISMMISKHLVTDAPKTTLGPIGTDARTRAARPTNVEEFQERWGSVSDVSDGKCTPRPRRLEMEMEPD